MDTQIVLSLRNYVSDACIMNLMRTCKLLYKNRLRIHYTGKYYCKFAEEFGIPLCNFHRLYSEELVGYPVYKLSMASFIAGPNFKYLVKLHLYDLEEYMTLHIPPDWRLKKLIVQSHTYYDLTIEKDLQILEVDDKLASIKCQRIRKLYATFTSWRLFSGMTFHSVMLGDGRADRLDGTVNISTRKLHLLMYGVTINGAVKTNADSLYVSTDDPIEIYSSPSRLSTDYCFYILGMDYSRLKKVTTHAELDSRMEKLEKATLYSSLPEPFKYGTFPNLRQVKLRERDCNDIRRYPAPKLKYTDGSIKIVPNWQRWFLNYVPETLLPLGDPAYLRVLRYIVILISMLLIYEESRPLRFLMLVPLSLTALPLIIG